jgi:hypothetical protein
MPRSGELIRDFDMDPEEFDRLLAGWLMAAPGEEEVTPAGDPAMERSDPAPGGRLQPDLVTGFAMFLLVLIGALVLRP